MIELLKLGKTRGYGRLEEAIEDAVGLGCWDWEAVRCLIESSDLDRRQVEPLDVGALVIYEQELPSVKEYDYLTTVDAAIL